jgi:hypothetical protein
MAILNPDHLFEQATRLIARPPAGRPRQADLRRAISSAYYGLFHFLLASVADEFVGRSQRRSSRYALVYRSIGHRALKELCIESARKTPTARYAAHVPAGGLGADIQEFARATLDLQDRRHIADYDPQASFRTSDAKLAISAAVEAIRLFANAGQDRRRAFLTLLLCPPRYRLS